MNAADRLIASLQRELDEAKRELGAANRGRAIAEAKADSLEARVVVLEREMKRTQKLARANANAVEKALVFIGRIIGVMERQ